MIVRSFSSVTRRLILGGSVLTVAVAGLASVATNAFFTDTKDVTANTFTAGTVTLTATPASAALTMATMAPGDTQYGAMTVTNTGSLAQRYALSSVTSESVAGFAAELQLTIKVVPAACDSTTFAASATTASPVGVFGSLGGTKTFGDKAAGNSAGDRVLAAGASEVLCAQVALPTTTGNTFKLATSTAVFTFDAEQTTNN